MRGSVAEAKQHHVVDRVLKTLGWHTGSATLFVEAVDNSSAHLVHGELGTSCGDLYFTGADVDTILLVEGGTGSGSGVQHPSIHMLVHGGEKHETKEVAGVVLLVVVVECAEVIARHKGGGSIGGGGLCDQGTCLRNCCELTEAFSAIEGNMTSRVAKGAA